MKNVKKTLNKAFTLIELVVVMAVIAILAGVSVGVYFGVINNANQSAVDQEAAQAQQAILVETTGNGFDGEIKVSNDSEEEVNLIAADMLNSTDLELKFDSPVTTDTGEFGDVVDNALEAIYLLSLANDSAAVQLDADIVFNALIAVGVGNAVTSTTAGSQAETNTITVKGFQYQNGNGKTATVYFGD